MENTLQSINQGVDVRVLEYTPQEITDLCNNGKAGDVARCVNADRRQKVALVQFRDDLSDVIEKLGYARKVTTIQKDGKAVEVPDETEGKHISRFVDALATGNFTPADFTLIGQDDKAKEACATAYLQKLAFTCGDEKDEQGNSCYKLDIARPDRQPGTGLLPKWAKDGAANILKGTNAASWVEKFTNGFTSPEGIAIDPVAFSSFVDVAPAGSTPEVIEQTLQRNIKHLAAALVAYDKQKRAKSQSEFA